MNTLTEDETEGMQEVQAWVNEQLGNVTPTHPRYVADLLDWHFVYHDFSIQGLIASVPEDKQAQFTRIFARSHPCSYSWLL